MKKNDSPVNENDTVSTKFFNKQQMRTWLNGVNYLIAPIAIGLFPILFFFSENMEELTLGVLFQPVIIVIASSLVSLAVLGLVFKNIQKTSLAVVVFWILFFSYGRVFTYTEKTLPHSFGKHGYLLALWGILFFVAMFGIWKAHKAVPSVLQAIKVVGLFLLLFQVVNIALNYNRESKNTTLSNSYSYLEENENKTFSSEPIKELPDIYYIMLDSYPRSDTLKEYFGFDNSDFDTSLRERGFYIADKSHASYNQTAYSVPATMNMAHIKDLKTQVVSGTALFSLYKNNKVFKYLKPGGYKFVNNSNLYISSYNTVADVNVDCGKNNEFVSEIIRTTALVTLKQLENIERKNKRSDALCVFSNISNEGQNMVSSPKLVFTHLLPPHPPYLFGVNGEDVQDVNLSLSAQTRWKAKGPYIAQLKYVNKRVSETVSQILNKSKNSIIIIHSDHGTYSSATEATTINDTRPIVLKERSRNYTAIYVPEYCNKKEFYAAMTSVNVFRAIFNSCFNAGYKMLDDKVLFVPGGKFDYKNYEDITDKVGE